MSSDTTNESSGALPPAQQLNTIPPRKYPEKTGGLPPKFQLSSIPRRKSAELRGDPRPITPPPTAEQIAQTRDLVYEQRPFTDHTGNGALSLFRSLVKKDRKHRLIILTHPSWKENE